MQYLFTQIFDIQFIVMLFLTSYIVLTVQHSCHLTYFFFLGESYFSIGPNVTFTCYPPIFLFFFFIFQQLPHFVFLSVFCWFCIEGSLPGLATFSRILYWLFVGFLTQCYGYDQLCELVISAIISCSGEFKLNALQLLSGYS